MPGTAPFDYSDDANEGTDSHERRSFVGVLITAALMLALLLGVSLFEKTPAPRAQAPQSQRVDRIAGVIVGAVEAYKLEQGAYPQRLEDLCPKYLRSLPDDATWTYAPAKSRRDFEFVYVSNSKRVVIRAADVREPLKPPRTP